MNKRALLLAVLSCWGISIIAQEKINVLLDNYGIKITAEMMNNRLHGKYISHYSNGKKCAQGHFEQGFRTGKWAVWDSLGNKKTVRLYKAPYNFELIFPALSDSLKPIAYTPKPSEDGTFEYFLPLQSDIFFEKNIWRTLSAKENPLLFKDAELYNLLLALIKEKTITCYADDNFKTILELNATDLENIESLHFKVREVFFFDTKRQISDTRILSFCPVVKDTKSQETKDLCWLYFPNLRPYIVDLPFESEELPFEIRNIDACFFYHYFSGQIIKESNVYNRSLVDYVSEDKLEEEATRIEMDMIEMEHKVWMELVKQPR